MKYKVLYRYNNVIIEIECSNAFFHPELVELVPTNKKANFNIASEDFITIIPIKTRSKQSA